MLELLFVMALTIIGVALAVLGVGMANSSKKNNIGSKIETYKSSVSEKVNAINEFTKVPLGIASLVKTYVTEDTGRGEFANYENALEKSKSLREYGASGIIVEHLLGKEAYRQIIDEANARYDRGFKHDSDESDLSWTERRLSSKEYNAIYKELVDSGETIEGVKIRETAGPRDTKGRLYYKAKVNADSDTIDVEKYMARGEKKYALHHELIEYKLRKEGNYTNEGYVERRVWEHIMKSPTDHVEEMNAIIKHYKELDDAGKAVFKEIEANNPEAMKFYRKYFPKKGIGV